MLQKKDLWLWGQDPGSHHSVRNNMWNLPGNNTMTSMEGAKYLGIPNICRITMNGYPEPPFDAEAEKLISCPEVVWSIMGDSESKRFNGGQTDLDAVLAVAKKYPNITGAAMDDFFSGTRMQYYTPQVIAELAAKLHENGLKLWSVVYEDDLQKDIAAHLEQCDYISFWSWCGEAIYKAENNFTTLKNMLSSDKRLYAGCYFWDYGNSKPLSTETMQYQLDLYEKLYDARIISGIIFCSNCIADIGLATVELTRKWIREKTI